MINRKKVFWVVGSFTAIFLLLYDLPYERANAFPNLLWVIGYFLLIAIWAALAGLVAVVFVMAIQHRQKIIALVLDGITSVGRWFTS